MTRYILWVVAAVALLGITATGIAADSYTVINTYGAAPFVYSGYSYVPLKSAADFVGAALLWDSLQNRATITYRNRELGLVVGSHTAYYMGQPVALPVPPVVVNGQMLVPVTVFDRYFDVPVRWEPDYNRVLLQGPPGWGYYQVLPYAPPYVVTVIHGYGPPPWAPAHGYRRHQQPVVYAPAPFVYYGTTYIPLRDAADFIGAALLWDHLRNRAVITFNGREIALVIGSTTVYYGPQVIVLPAPPVVVGGAVYVPSTLFERHMSIPVQRDGGVLKLKGPKGWRDFRVASTPPGYVYGTPQRERERERERERTRVGFPAQRGPEPGRASGPWMRTQDRRGPEPGRGQGPWMKQTQKPSPPKSAGPPKSAPKPAPKPTPAKKEDAKQKQGSGWFGKAKGN
ncbi:MAG: copper amine oxidase N-terminal domain-containing protein [Armatimonadota bacterium]|nr:MAG: copper amine oxidase N-terminal domain-containing protein [Armatimonadota bacterium]